MAGPDDNNPPNDTHNDDHLAEKLSRLSADQLALYRNHVEINHELNGRVSRVYELKLADALLKNLPANQLSHEVKELNRQESQYTYWRAQPDRAKPAKEAPGSGRTSIVSDQNAPRHMQQVELDRADPLKGKVPHAPLHDYSTLQATHEQLATSRKTDQLQPAAVKTHDPTSTPAAPLMSKDALSLMLEHFPEIRREANLPVTRAEIDERANLSRAQDADRQKLDQEHGTQPNQRQHTERNLLDHQHLAEQVGVQAKYIARQLKANGSPEAAHYDADARRAFHTARGIHEQRQKLDPEIDRSGDAKRGAEGQQAQRQNAERQPNRSPEARYASEGKTRSDAGRETTGGSKDQTAQKGNSNPGKSPSGGRGGR
jgi:hypothetical protein